MDLSNFCCLSLSLPTSVCVHVYQYLLKNNIANFSKMYKNFLSVLIRQERGG